MSKETEITSVLNQWLISLDNGDLDGMVDTCDPEVVVCNERQPTSTGLQGIRDKYGPRIEGATFKSGFENQHTLVIGDIALVVGRFSVEATSKATAEVSQSEGRVVIGYRRHADGKWKMLLDVDNNDETDD